MEHPDWPAFLSAILANPDDDTVRLVAADFLEENGDPDRAAFIRVQIELARLEAHGQAQPLEADKWRAKERAYLGPLSMFRLQWAAEACPELVTMKPPPRGAGLLALPQVEGADQLTWRRGFVEEITCPTAKWLRHGTAVRSRQPVRVVTLTPPVVTRDEWYANLGALRGLRYILPLYHGAEFVHWLQQRLPGTEVSDLPF